MEKDFKFLIVVEEYEKEIICQRLKDAGVKLLLDYNQKSFRSIDPNLGIYKIFVKNSDFDRAKLVLSDIGKNNFSKIQHKRTAFDKVINVFGLIVIFIILIMVCYYFLKRLLG